MLTIITCPECGKQFFAEFGVEVLEFTDFKDDSAVFRYSVEKVEVEATHSLKEIYDEVKPLIIGLIKDQVPKQKIINEIISVYGIIREDAEMLYERIESEVLECNRYT
mgnify:CR=1 FL=1